VCVWIEGSWRGSDGQEVKLFITARHATVVGSDTVLVKDGREGRLSGVTARVVDEANSD